MANLIKLGTVLQKYKFKISGQKLKADKDCESQSVEEDDPDVSRRTTKRRYLVRRRRKRLGLPKMRDLGDDIV
jgi:hypothetical protein